MKISKGSGKMKHISSINTNTLTNPFCKKMQKCKGTICSDCYSMNMLKTHRKNCVPSWQGNSDLLTKPLEDIPVVEAALCRFHSHGELINALHYENFCLIAKENPWTRFVLFTKRIDLVDPKLAPDNMALVYSNPRIDDLMLMPPDGFDTVFNVVTKGQHNCQLSCFTCGMCWMKDKSQCIVEKLK